MSSPPFGWLDATLTSDLNRKIYACQRMVHIASQLVGKELPLRKSVTGPPAPGIEIMPLSVLEEFGRATKTFKATIDLALSGYGQQAYVLNR